MYKCLSDLMQNLIRYCRHWRISHAKSCMQISNFTQLVGLFRSFVQSDAKLLRVHRCAASTYWVIIGWAILQKKMCRIDLLVVGGWLPLPSPSPIHPPTCPPQLR